MLLYSLFSEIRLWVIFFFVCVTFITISCYINSISIEFLPIIECQLAMWIWPSPSNDAEMTALLWSSLPSSGVNWFWTVPKGGSGKFSRFSLLLSQWWHWPINMSSLSIEKDYSFFEDFLCAKSIKINHSCGKYECLALDKYTI